MMNLFLKQVSKDFKNYKIIIQVDQAAWHKSKTLKIPKNIALVEQPPYSPELNPVEQIWAEIREKFLDNKLFESMDILTEKLSEALKEIDRYGEKLVSLTSFPHLKGLVQNANQYYYDNRIFNLCSVGVTSVPVNGVLTLVLSFPTVIGGRINSMFFESFRALCSSACFSISNFFSLVNVLHSMSTKLLYFLFYNFVRLFWGLEHLIKKSSSFKYC